jgi:universal stress protein A
MFINPKKILWPTDFSPLSFKALAYANGLREVFDSRLHVVNVAAMPVNPVISAEIRHPSSGIEVTDRLLESARRELEKLKQSFKNDQTITFIALIGIPWYEICQYAKENDIELIIVATHGSTGLKHVLMGSVAERIVQHAACPVLVVKSVERDFTG